MTKNCFAPEFSELPDSLPIFPLTGALLLPGGDLPLNIFEPRYLDMVNAALAGARMIGMIQPKEHGGSALYGVGCAGKITEFSETEDGRYLITLKGVCRFGVHSELDTNTQFRQIQPDWSDYKKDLNPETCLGLDRDALALGLKAYFQMEGLSCEWEHTKDISDGALMTCLSMICPFEPKEKQALLEAKCCKSRATLFMKLLDFALHGSAPQDSRTQH